MNSSDGGAAGSDELLDPRDFAPTMHLVYDDDGGWLLLAAYTEGFWARGVPELHLRAYLDGDAGLLWSLHADECVRILDEISYRLVTGELAVGDRVDRTFDDGTAHMVLTLGEPVPPARVRARSLAPKTRVIPLTWELRGDDPALLPQPLSPMAERTQRAVLGRVLAQVPAGARLRAPFRRPARTSPFDPNRRLGPLTPIVQAQAAAVAHAPMPTIMRFVDTMLRARRVRPATETVDELRRAARRAGRAGVVEPTITYAEDVLLAVIGKRGTRRWRSFTDEAGSMLDEHLDELVQTLFEATVTLLVSRAVADVAPQSTLLAGIGPWEAARSACGFDAGPAWHASGPIRQAVLGLLRQCDQHDLSWLTMRHNTHRVELMPMDRPLVETDYAWIVMTLEGLAVTGASGCPPAAELLGADGELGQWLRSAPGVEQTLTRWALCVSTLLSERMRFSADQVSVFADPMRSLFPGLESLLNNPVVAQSA
jgi:hypothetical protein